MVTIDKFDIFAFVVFGVLFVCFVAIVVVLGGLPGKIAYRRGHPHAAAITAAGWISLATVFTLWPIAFVWAFLEPRSGPRSQSGAPTP
jgi:hypothetical protein